MLFHVTMTHTPDNCPAYHTERMPELLASMVRLEEVGRETNVTAHSLLWGAPDYVAFAVLEAGVDSVWDMGPGPHAGEKLS